MAAFTVVYDACVLYPAPLRDLLMRLALTDLFRAKWTDAIHEEWISNVLKDRPDLTRPQLERTRDLMNTHVRDCLVEGYEHLVPCIELPDPNDHHVVAAAIHARADAIVTFNLKDFPPAVLNPLRLESLHPDDFIRHQIDLDTAAVLVAAQRHRATLRNPPKTAAEYLETLERQSLPKTVAALRGFAGLL
jgi:predicted nucleic acid-binding protein